MVVPLAAFGAITLIPPKLLLNSKPLVFLSVEVAWFCISSAATDEVAVPATVVVAKYKFPPAFLNAHCASPAPAESESCDAVEEARVSVADIALLIVEVPIAIEDVVADTQPKG